MKFNPHEYQKYAIDFILDHPEAAIFLDCGLGKTAITLSAINSLMFDSFEIYRVLIVAPLRVAKNTWSEEIVKWDDFGNLQYSVAVGTEKERIAALKTKADIYIINRENVQWLVESGLKIDFDMIVVDELSSFKNHQAKRFKSLMKLRAKARRVVGLTGTPSANGLMDLWAEFKLLDMGQRLGKFIGQYRNSYFTPDKRNGQIVFSYKPLPGAEKQIYNKISDITISMKAADFLRMPELVSVNRVVELSGSEKEKYENLKKEMVLDLPENEITAANAAALSNKLLQMANGAVYAEDGEYAEIHSRKLDALEDIIESANDKPLLVAYWFKHDLRRIKKRFGVREIKTPKDIDDWNNGKIQLAAIHPASAGHGLNLQNGGSCLVWYSLTWSLELYQQTNARLWRQGQTSETVVIQHIITKNTIDERVMKALSAKDIQQSALIDAVRAEIGKVGFYERQRFFKTIQNYFNQDRG